MAAMEPRPASRGTLVAGGKYHDFDYARLRLSELAFEHDHLRLRVCPDYEDAEAIAAGDFLISYTCDVRPSVDAQDVISNWVKAGGRWLALHGTNSALDLGGPNGVEAPRCFPTWVETLGSQFLSHPPIQPYDVEVADPSHWLVAGIDAFEVDDELYLMEHIDRDALHPLLTTSWSGTTPSFVDERWDDTEDSVRLVSYLRSFGDGSVLYNTLGHCRGHYDMEPVLSYYPDEQRGAWEKPEFIELLRRGMRWAMGETA